MRGTLTLIPTPIDDETLLLPSVVDVLTDAFKNGAKFLIEDLKPGRRRWVKYGLPREAIDQFILYNEHTRDEICKDIVNELKSGQNFYLMSDCGLPAFCDPGQKLVDLCHKNKIEVTSTPFSNSIALAVALSGFDHSRFVFEGFIPVKTEARKKELKRILKEKCPSILMDTPYRLKKLLAELLEINFSREVFIGMDLNKENQRLVRGSISQVCKIIGQDKAEFICILGPSL